jgi:hypothetical protein
MPVTVMWLQAEKQILAFILTGKNSQKWRIFQNGNCPTVFKKDPEYQYFLVY